MNNAKQSNRGKQQRRPDISSNKIGENKQTFHARMVTIKDRNSEDLTKTKDIKRWQEYTEELYKKGLYDLANHNGVVTHLEPGILG